ncbi:MAG: bifunctional tetrahydrofolate synthase/dihydrofolate synthase [Gammaproteobacteria bacterium]|nr:bifunctional tetrahydrofolate synthase/dihydrofolate synthase [Gammaproteobacteria bacterium]NIR83087.1 bifunctional tetrahydrofolate synthase/dihydrofolate synthase [Gammaproteobacteria bacterium]NIR90749.1 bifunctional tetrahydrofolate synthase/dihydrofolate synthase [Gammaproteobacteria bacterium]NIU04240.1 bifunctional tetrahydrofolate synthase/dihydrofolate synthase [Gammaproteobacteria bacterium]NIV51532.1 bifunctional tetrahydrofolate synthase/dihydrofolate synthase [Gammaproteobacter
MRFRTLSEWLRWQETLHPKAMDLGLERCAEVAARMGLLAAPFAVVTVGGTNGKGSCVAMLDAVLRAGGHRTGAYTTPHLLCYNERIAICGRPVSDATLMRSFQRIDAARGQTTLTYFEFGTLAALDIFARSGVEVALLEVGLGGRLDAVNVLDADIALVTTVDVDHVEWLGENRDIIAREKAGIFRSGRPAVCGDAEAPATLEACALERGTTLHRLAREYDFEETPDGWLWRHGETVLEGLPRPGVGGAFQLQNAAAALMVLELLKERLPVSEAAVHAGLRASHLPARFQIFRGPVERIVDGAHNAQAARALARGLRARRCTGRTLAVFAMLADKDVVGVAGAVQELVDAWYLGGLAVPRGASVQELMERLKGLTAGASVAAFGHVAAAYAAARSAAEPGDRVIAFGSFHTAAQALRLES